MLHLLLGFFWFVSIVKAKLFWLYLWQLKDYHAGRFIDHFQTSKGISIFLNPIFAIKLVFLLSLPFLPMLLGAVVLFYIVESAHTVRHAFRGMLLKPIFTKKILLLILAGLVLISVFAFILLQNGIELKSFAFWLTLFDVASPVIFSSLVFLLQPFSVFMRNRIINSATKKREQRKNLIVIGITGSYGKTSTKEFLAHILAEVPRIKDQRA